MKESPYTLVERAFAELSREDAEELVGYILNNYGFWIKKPESENVEKSTD